jgi:threonine aldolase
MNFASDNTAGIAPAILEAIVAANAGSAPAYGADSHTQRAEAALSETFERPVASFLIATGTGANALALGAVTSPWSAVFCHEEAHIHDDNAARPNSSPPAPNLSAYPARAAKSRRPACAKL